MGGLLLLRRLHRAILPCWNSLVGLLDMKERWLLRLLLMEIVSETHTTLKHHRILVVQAAEQVVSIQELVLERLFALAQIL